MNLRGFLSTRLEEFARKVSSAFISFNKACRKQLFSIGRLEPNDGGEELGILEWIFGKKEEEALEEKPEEKPRKKPAKKRSKKKTAKKKSTRRSRA